MTQPAPEITHGSLSAADIDSSAAAPLQPPVTTRFTVRTFDKVRWRCRRGVERVIAQVPREAWANPSRQSWRRVKKNAERTVWRARIGDNFFYIKYYRQSWRTWFKSLFRGEPGDVEWRTGLYALSKDVPAVRPLALAERVIVDGRAFSILVTQSADPAEPLDAFWFVVQRTRSAIRRRRNTAYLTDLLAEMIAKAHQAGFEHRDMHAANILVRTTARDTYETVFVDLQSAQLARPVSDFAVVRNLAQLNQWFRRHSSVGDRLRFLRSYLRWRNEYEPEGAYGRPLGLTFEQLVHALAARAGEQAQQIWTKRDRRSQRSNQYFTRLRMGGGWRGWGYLSCKRPLDDSLASRTKLTRDWWRERLRDPLAWFAPENGDSCKDSHSAMVSRAVLPAEPESLEVIVKRPLARNGRRQLRNLLPPSRSMRGWQIGCALLHRDIPTARPLAVLERKVGPFVRDSVLLTEAIPGAVCLKTHLTDFRERCAPQRWWLHKHELTEMLARQVRTLVDRGFVHRDCKAQNLLVVNFPSLRLYWVDMDGLRLAPHITRAQELRPLARLCVSLLDVPDLTRTDWARFLKRYFARYGADPSAWRTAWRELSPIIEQKLDARQKRRKWKLENYGRE